MLKFLLLALLFGLAYAKLEGKWYNIAVAADKVEKMEKQDLRLYTREVKCEEECKKMKVTFYVNENGQCTETTATGYMQEDGETYRAQYSGDNNFKPEVTTEKHIVFTSVNVDKAGQETKLIFVLGKDPVWTPEDNEKLAKLAQEKDIPPENI